MIELKKPTAPEQTATQAISEQLDSAPSAPINISQPTPPAINPDLFGGWLGNMIRAESAATETPPELAGLFGLSVIAACVQSKYEVCVTTSYFEPLSIWAVTALDSGNRKSAVMKSMNRPLFEWERAKAQQIEPERVRIEDARETAEMRIKSLRGKAAKEKNSIKLIHKFKLCQRNNKQYAFQNGETCR